MEGESNDAMKPLEGLRSETEDAEECSESLPPGFRFHPTDEELVSYYLTNKILDSSFTGRAIAEADLNKCEPWDLPGKAKMGEKEWYFFSQRDRKYPTGLRTNRATEAGYWKTTGKDREVFNSQTSALVGMKKTLVFYKGRAPKGEKTNWVMHEYRLEGKFSYHRLPKNCKDEWVVCRIFQKNAGGKKSSSSSSLLNRNNFLDLPGSPSLPSLLESPYNTTTPVNENEPSVTLESDSTSSKPILVNTVPTKPNITHYLQNTFPEPSNNQFTDLDKLIKTSSYMENLNFLSPSSDHSSLNLNNLQGLFSLANLNMHKLQPLQSQLMYSPHMNPLLPNFPSLHFSQGSHLNNQIMAQSNLMLRSFESQPNIIVDPSQKQPMDGSQRISQNNQEPTHNTDTEINEDVASANCNEDGAHNIDFDSMWSFREHPF